MDKVAGFIVDKRRTFLMIFLASCLFCLYAIPKVNINYDLTKYLPGDSVTKKALDVAEEEFGLNSIASVIVEKVTPGQAKILAEELSNIDGVLVAQFDENSSDYYKDGHALIQITLNEGDYSDVTHRAIKDIEEALTGYETEMYGSGVHAVRQLEDVGQQMILILAVSIPIIFLILFLNANSYAEIIVFGLVAGVSVLLNKGTNIFLGDISFVTNSIAIVLQLALAMDYSIILLHRFEEEKANHPEKEAITRALKNSFSSISASSLTTIVGLVAIMFMQYTIGFDIGMVLAKSILCSMLTVFLFMPGILLMFSKWIDRTKHKTFIPNLRFIPRFVFKTRLFMPAILILVIILAFSFQTQNTYSFRFETEARRHADLFGESNTLIIIVPKGDSTKEREIIDLMGQKTFVNTIKAIGALGLRDPLTVEQFASRTGLDIKTATGIYGYYAMSVGQIYKRIPFDQLLDFMLENHDDLELSTEEYTNLLKITSLWANKDLLLSASYMGRILNLTPEEATQVFATYEMNQNSRGYPLTLLVDYIQNNSEQWGFSPADLENIKDDASVNAEQLATILNIAPIKASIIMASYGLENGYHVKPHNLSSILPFLEESAGALGLDEEQTTMVGELNRILKDYQKEMTPEEFYEMVNTTRDKAMLLYGLYTVNNTLPSFIFSDLVLFLADNYALLGMDSSQAEVLLSTKETIEKTFGTFESNEYARLVFNLNLETDDPDAINLVSDLRADLIQYYDEYYLLGDSANILDVQAAFDRDVFYVNTITVVLILLILILTFRSLIVPFLLVLIIQGSIWINFSFSTLSDVSIIFLGYIIITAIQMGATIDYAIIITGRYQEFRKQYDKYQAVSEAIRLSIPTLLTSGGILIVSGFCVGFVSTASSISNLGILIGRGAFISLVLVTFFLPQFLLICDRIVSKTDRKQANETV